MKFAVALALVASTAAWGHERRAVKIEVPFETVRGAVIIRVTMAGRQGDFLLDTGAEILLADRQFLGVPTKDARRGPDGVTVVDMAKVNDFWIGGHCFGRRTVGLMDFAALSKSLGRRISGTVGQDVLREFDSVNIDYKRGMVTLTIQGDDDAAGVR